MASRDLSEMQIPSPVRQEINISPYWTVPSNIQ
jgi:hypothetical protein